MSQRWTPVPPGATPILQVDARSGGETVTLDRITPGTAVTVRRVDSVAANTATVVVPAGLLLDDALNGTTAVGPDSEKTFRRDDTGFQSTGSDTAGLATTASVTAAVAAQHATDLSTYARIDDTDLASAPGRSLYIPTFTKDPANPKFLVSGLLNMASIEFPCLLRVDGIFGGPGPYGETYRCYYSTDHANSTAGIGLFTFNSWSGAWTDRGQIFVDSSGGNQTENPSVVYVPETGLFHMYYHQNNATGALSSQVVKLATMSLATARVGDSWTITTAITNGIVLDNPVNGAFPSNGGWGYFKPFRLGSGWFGHYRNGGAADLSFGFARSADGIRWHQDGRLLYFASDKMHDPLGRFNPSSHFPDWGSGSVIQWRGRIWWIGVLIPFEAQYQSPSMSWVVMAPLSDDFRKFIATPTVLFTADQAWETSYTGKPVGMGNHRYGVSVLVEQGVIHLAYLDGSVTITNDVAQTANIAAGIGMAVGS